VVEQRKNAYRKLIVRDGKLMGAILVGNTAAAATLVQSFDRGDPLPEDPLEALCPGMTGGAAATSGERTVCNCNKVTEDGIKTAIAAGADSVERVCAATRAGTGCGSCKGELARLVSRHRLAPVVVAAAG
jgi:nitrite reductase (NADH) large subunit